jgi:hypothetical protein
MYLLSDLLYNKLTIPNVQPFPNAVTGRFQAGAYGGGGQGGRSRRGGRNKWTPFANYQQMQQGGGGRGAGTFVPQAPTAFVLQARTVAFHSRFSQRCLQTSMCVTPVGSTSKRDIHLPCAPGIGASQITTTDSRALMRRSTSTQVGIHAQRGCTKHGFQGFDNVGQRRP